MQASPFAILAICLAASAGAGKLVTHRATNTDPSPATPGEPPYEMAGRVEERTPLVAFDDVEGWTVEGTNAEGWLTRTKEQRLHYRPYAAKLVYVARGKRPSLLVRPPKPIPIPEPWDCVNVWNYGNVWAWARRADTPPLHCSVVVEGADGRQTSVPMGSMPYIYWFLAHRQAQRDIQRPAKLIGFRFTGGRNTQKRTVYLGPCYFYKQVLEPLTFEPWPHTLPFPTRPETILPTNSTRRFRNTVRRDGDATLFAYRGRDCELVYSYTPTNATLGDIELHHAGKAFRPCAGGGLQLATAKGNVPPGDPAVKTTLLGQELDDDVLTVRWRLAVHDVTTGLTYRLRIRQKSLLVDIEATAPVVERIALGRAEPVEKAKLFWMPYWTYGGNDPRVLLANGLFVTTQFDWFESNASVLYGAAAVGPTWAAYNGGAQYVPKTDGQRNPVRERLFLTASPNVHEVLPTIPNPPSPMKKVQGDRLWRVKSGANHAAEITEARRLRWFGAENITIRYHEDSWRDAGESFTFRLEAAPKRGGDEALRKFVAAVQALGWRVGLYTNYTDYAPVNKHWNEDWVSRTPTGEWQRAWARCYAPKPMRAVEAQAHNAPRIQAKFGENHSYCDVHTAVTPFQRVDYDARVPGAGTFRRTFQCFGRLLYNEKFAHKGPVYSEGRNHWWYVGLTDGNYAQLVCGSPPAQPLLVDFDLLKMHPLNMDAGMGSPGMFFKGKPHNLDQFIATTLAYGHIGFFDWRTHHGKLKNYYMLQRLEPHYTMVPVARIAYDHEGTLVDTSAALATDAYKQSRVHVAYRNGTKVYVNGSQADWSVAGPWGNVVLPPWGYAGWNGDTVSLSARLPVLGPQAKRGPVRRADLSIGHEQLYADSRGGFVFLDKIAVQGAAALKREGGQWWVIPCSGFADFAFEPDCVDKPSLLRKLFGRPRDFDIEAVALDGSKPAAPAVRWSRGLCHILPKAKGDVKYRITPTTRHRPRQLEHHDPLAILGQSIEVKLPRNAHVQPDALAWEIDGQRTAAKGAVIKGRILTCPVPDAKPRAHLWLAIPTDGDTLWLDFIAAEPLELTLVAPPDIRLTQGTPLPVELIVRSNLPRPATIDTSIHVATPAASTPIRRTIQLQAGAAERLGVRLPLPWAPGDCRLAASARIGQRTVGKTLPVRPAWDYPVVIDLADASVARQTGYCSRGKPETPMTGDVQQGEFRPVTMRSGTVARRGLFAHPPYSRYRAGYVFATFGIQLPAEPATFDFWLGMRNAPGLDASDGSTYKVVVIDASGKAHDLFSQHYTPRDWKHATVDLAQFAGQTVRLKLITDCGPKDNTIADHTLWGQPRVVLKQKLLRVSH